MTENWVLSVARLADGSKTAKEIATTLGISRSHVMQAVKAARSHGTAAWLAHDPKRPGLYTRNKDTLDALFDMQGGICFLCLEPAIKPTIDHLEPVLGKRGIARLHISTTIEGHDARVMACSRCNSLKGSRQPTDIERRRFLEMRTGDAAWKEIVE